MKHIKIIIFFGTMLYWVAIYCNSTFVFGNPFDNDLIKHSNTDKLITGHNESGFIENRGQMTDVNKKPVDFVLFKAEAQSLNFWITENGFVIETRIWEKVPISDNEMTESDKLQEEMRGRRKTRKYLHWERIDVELKGATIKKENIIMENPHQGHYNFFGPHCPDGIYEVRQYGKITIKDVYPGIDWVFYRESEGYLKYDFIVHPGSSYETIELIYRSKQPVSINQIGQLNMFTDYGKMEEDKPVSFYNDLEIETEFWINYQKEVVYNDDKCYETSVKFNCFLDPEIEKNRSEVLIIDPQLYWSTFFGGNDFDGTYSMAYDGSGNIFISGYLASTDFPAADPGGGAYFQGTSTGGRKCYFSKFSNSGVLLWSTYYGVSNDDAFAITVDDSGNVFATGRTMSSGFPTQNPGGGAYYQASRAGIEDAFILKFDNNGVRQWATYFGGSNSFTLGYSIVTDSNGNVFITGKHYSVLQNSSFPMVDPGGGAYNQTFAGNDDIFISKFSNSGNLLWSTLYGGSSNEHGFSITTDISGNVYVTGVTESSNLPVYDPGSGAYFDGSFGGGTIDAFILKFSNTGVRQWATYYGGSGNDRGLSIITDSSENVFTIGTTSSTNMETQDPGGGAYFQSANAGGQDVYILKFDNSGSRIWATYFGGSDNENMDSWDNLAIDLCDNVFISFDTQSNNVPTMAACDGGFLQSSKTGPKDLFLASFKNDGILSWATYLGGDGEDFRSPLEMVNGELFVSGEWTGVISSSTYPLVNPGSGAYYDPTFNGSFSNPNNADDSFLMKFLLDTCFCSNVSFSVNITPVNSTCYSLCDGTATANAVGGNAPFTYSWNTSPVQTTQTISGLCAGTYIVTITDATSETASATVVISEPSQIVVDLGADQSICIGDTVVLDAGSGYITYEWNTSQSSQSIIVTAEGTYTVTVSDSNGCEATGSVNIIVTNQQDATISPAGPFCENDDALNLQAVDSGGIWTGTGITNSSAGTFSPSIAGTGTHVITYSISGSCGDIDSVQIVVYETPEISFSGHPLEGCSPLAVEFNDTSPQASQWQWLFGDGNNGSNNQNPSYTYGAPGQYDVTLTITNTEGCSATLTIAEYILVYSQPSADFYTIPEIGKTYQPIITFYSDSYAQYWHWIFGDGNVSNSPPPVTHTYPEVESQYEVTLIVSNEFGCSDSISKFVYIIDDNIVIPNVITPNGDGYNDYFVIENADKYPNNVLLIFNRWGKLVFEQQNYDNNWDGGDLADGTYFVIFKFLDKEYHGSLTIIKGY